MASLPPKKMIQVNGITKLNPAYKRWKNGGKAIATPKQSTIDKIVVKMTIIQGEGLVAKDRNLIGQKTSSDPYIQVWQNEQKMIGKTDVQMKTLAPKYNDTFLLEYSPAGKNGYADIVSLKIFDYDRYSDDDHMGTVTILIPTATSTTTKWYSIPGFSAKNATGRLEVSMETEVFRSAA